MVRNIVTCIKVGLGLSAFYCVIALVMYVARGAEPFESIGLSLGKILFSYVGGGILGGLVVGLLLPFVRSRFSAMVVASIAGMIVISGFQVLDKGIVAWNSSAWLMVVVLGVTFGCAGVVGFTRLH